LCVDTPHVEPNMKDFRHEVRFTFDGCLVMHISSVTRVGKPPPFRHQGTNLRQST
jgi:hypothetical protein